MDWDGLRQAYLHVFTEAGHDPELNEDTGKPDFMAIAYETHNGLRCKKCGFWQCMWCSSEKAVERCEPVSAV